MTTYTPERVEITVDGEVVAETAPEPRVLVVDDRRVPLRALLPLLAFAGLAGTLPVAAPAAPRRREPPPPPAPARAFVRPKPTQCPHGVAMWQRCRECTRAAARARGGAARDAVDSAAEKRARKAAKLEAAAARGGIRRSS